MFTAEDPNVLYIDIHYRHVNGDPSAVVFSEDSPYAVLVMDLTPESDQVRGIYAVVNPDKLARVRSEESESESAGSAGSAESEG